VIDFAKYGVQEWASDPMSMDRRHVEWLRECLRKLRPTMYVEIGACHGVSTVAGIEAVKAAEVQRFHVIDVAIKPSVQAMAADVAGVTLHEGTSVDVLPRLAVVRPLAVLIDGDHTLQGVQPELEQVLRLRPHTIFAHDVTAEAAGHDACDGSAWLWQELQRRGWHCHLDARKRHGEATHRGMLVATIGTQVHVTGISDAWMKTCGHA
jgi:hypothetical protein